MRHSHHATATPTEFCPSEILHSALLESESLLSRQSWTRIVLVVDEAGYSRTKHSPKTFVYHRLYLHGTAIPSAADSAQSSTKTTTEPTTGTIPATNTALEALKDMGFVSGRTMPTKMNVADNRIKPISQLRAQPCFADRSHSDDGATSHC